MSRMGKSPAFQIHKHEDAHAIKRRLHALIETDEDGCWIFQGRCCKEGYGRFWVRGNSSELSHRASYALYKGRIRSGKVIDHKCSKRRCCNPDHLQQVSQSKNVRLGWRRKSK